jgi:hypothetical protein
MKRELLAVALFGMASIGIARADGTNNLGGKLELRRALPASTGAVAQAAGTNNPAEAAKPTGPAAKIQFDKVVYDFGSTALVESVTGTFTFQNGGDAELKVGAPKPSCGCTVASVKPDTLKPGDKGELVFKVNLGSSRGPLEKHITVPSNDPLSPNVTLAIKVEVKQIVEVSSGAISLGAIRQGVSTNASVTIRRVDGKKLVVGRIEPSSKLLQARLEPLEGTNADQAVKLNVEVNGEGAPRRFNDNVRVYLEGVNQPVATVFVNGQVLGDVIVDHESLYWSIMDPSRMPTNNPLSQQVRRVTISSARPGQPLEISNLTTSLKDLTVELTTVETGKTYVVVATLAGTPKKSEQGTVSFDTNTPAQPKVTIPVTIVVMGAH